MRHHLIEIFVGIILLYLTFLMVSPFFDVFIYAIFIYYVSRPFYERFKKAIHSKTVSALATLFLVIIPVTVITLYTVAVASIDLISFLKTVDLPYVSLVNEIVGEYSQLAQELGPKEIYDMVATDATLKNFYGTISDIFWKVIDLSFRLFLVFTLTFYLLLDGPKLRQVILKNFIGKKEKIFGNFLNQTDEDLSHVFVGNIVTALITGIIGMLLFHVLNLATSNTPIEIPYATLLGLMCGLTSLIPVVGVAIVWIPVTIYLFIQVYLIGEISTLWLYPIIYMVSTFVITDWLPNILIRPKLSGGRIHQGMMMFAYIFGSIVFGFKGLFIGPMILVLVVNYLEIILPRPKEWEEIIRI